MIRNRIRTLSLALIGAACALAAVGCSDNTNPLTSNSHTDAPLYRVTAGGDVEIAGRVNTVDTGARTITLANNPTVIVVQEGAEIVLRAAVDIAIGLGDIKTGDSLEARGQLQSDGSLSADRVRIRTNDDNGGGQETELYGRVATIDPVGRTMTLVGKATAITVQAGAEIVHKVSGAEIRIELAAIAVGDSVEVRGTLQANGSLSADRVRLRAGDENFASDVEFTSTITAIDYGAMTLTLANGAFVITDANTYIFVKVEQRLTFNSSASDGGDEDSDNRLHKPLLFSDLSLGDTVEVYANVLLSGEYYAVAIELEDGAFEAGLEVEFKTTLASVDTAGGVVTFNGQPWTGQVDGAADLRGLMNEPLLLTDFAAGQLVEVKGFKIGTDSLRVVVMHKDNK